MNKQIRAIVATALALFVVASGLNAAPAAADSSYFFDFEDSLKPWQADTDNPGESGYLEVAEGDGGCTTIHANHYAVLRAISESDAPKPTSTLTDYPRAPGKWMVAGLKTEPGWYDVTLRASARTLEPQTDSYAQLRWYMGAEAPARMVQFQDGGDLSSGWQEFTMKGRVVVPEASYDATPPAIYVAIGAGANVPAIGIDCVEVIIEPSMLD